MVTNLFGMNLEELLQVQEKKKFSMKTISMLGFELIDRLEYVHKKNLLYRDMKPENIMIGKEDDYR